MIKEFKLGGRQYTVKLEEDIDDNGLGRCYAPLGLIKISKTCNGKSLPEDSMEQTLYHEVLHAMLDELGYSDLSGDETFVQGLALMMHQFETSKK